MKPPDMGSMELRVIVMLCANETLRLKYRQRIEYVVQQQFGDGPTRLSTFSSFKDIDISDFDSPTFVQPIAVVLLGDCMQILIRDATASSLRFPSSPVLAVLASQEVLTGVPERFLASVDDYLVFPCRDEDMALRLRRLRKITKTPAVCSSRSSNLLGKSAVFLQTLAIMDRITAADATCLIEGETGTGKELFARAIHYSGRRRSRPFVPVNCGALPEALMENELFGHARGAYTDARDSDVGLIGCAGEGTLFLDEVDSLSSPAQVKLLRMLQEGEYRALGSTTIRKSFARIIAASNTSLREQVRRGLLREDLFHRLNILRIRIPPLRERGDDIALLAGAFLKRYILENKLQPKVLDGSAIEALSQYGWPGNVRELQAVMQRSSLLTDGLVITAAELELGDQDHSHVASQRLQPPQEMGVARTRLLNEFEQSYVRQALVCSHGNVSQAARVAGKDRRSFQRLLKKHGISIAEIDRARLSA